MSTSIATIIVIIFSCLTNMCIQFVVLVAFLSPFTFMSQTTVPDVRTLDGTSREEESSEASYVKNRLASSLLFPRQCVQNYTPPSMNETDENIESYDTDSEKSEKRSEVAQNSRDVSSNETLDVIQTSESRASESSTSESGSSDGLSACLSLESQQTSVVVEKPDQTKSPPVAVIDSNSKPSSSCTALVCLPVNQTSDSLSKGDKGNLAPDYQTMNPSSTSTALVCVPVAPSRKSRIESTTVHETSDALETGNEVNAAESDQNQLVVLDEDQTSGREEVNTEVRVHQTSDALETGNEVDAAESDQNQLVVIDEDQTSDPEEVNAEVPSLMNPKASDDETLSEATLRLFYVGQAWSSVYELKRHTSYFSAFWGFVDTRTGCTIRCNRGGKTQRKKTCLPQGKRVRQ